MNSSYWSGIHSCDGPIGDADSEEEEGDDWVEESRHNVADCSGGRERDRGGGERTGETEKQR